MKKTKIVMFILIIVVLIIIISILLVMKKEKKNTIIDDSKPQDEIVQVNSAVKRVNNDNQFYTVQNSITKYLTYLMQENKMAVYSLLDMNYKENASQGITQENVISLLKKDVLESVHAQEMYTTQTNTTATYYVFAYTKIQQMEKLNTDYYIVRMDYQNETFSIEPSNEETFSKARDGKVEIGENFKIEKTNYNQYEYQNITTGQMLQNYIDDYLLKAKYYPELAYAKLSEETKQRKYPTIESYQKDILQNANTIFDVQIREVDNEITENGFIYTGKDYHERSYKVITSGGLNYTISIME